MKRLAIFIAIFALGLVAHAAPYLGDFAEDATVHFIWSTNGADGASITRSTDGTISVYKANGTTQSTAGITDTEDFDGVTGQHACTIDLSADAFYATGANYTVVITGAVVDTKTVNAPIAHFSIENRFAEVNVTQIEGSDATDTFNARTLPSADYYDPVNDTVTVETNNDKTGYALTQTFPSNFAALAITAGGAVTAGTVSDKTGYALTQSFPENFADLSITPTTGLISVGTLTAGVINSGAFDTDAIGPGAIAAGAISKDDEITGFTNPLDAAGTRGALGLAAANLDTQLANLPTVAELTAALAAADDTVLAAIAALNDYDGSDTAGVTELLNRLTTLRAGYLDKLNIGAETLAHTGNADTFKADVSGLALESTAQAILDDTDDIGVAGAGLNAIPWSITFGGGVAAELATYDGATQTDIDPILEWIGQ